MKYVKHRSFNYETFPALYWLALILKQTLGYLICMSCLCPSPSNSHTWPFTCLVPPYRPRSLARSYVCLSEAHLPSYWESSRLLASHRWAPLRSRPYRWPNHRTVHCFALWGGRPFFWRVVSTLSTGFYSCYSCAYPSKSCLTSNLTSLLGSQWSCSQMTSERAN